jgi:carbon storage regulator
MMLILSRKKNESIVINDDITIVVVEIRGDKVRLGVEAPKEIPVHRREVFEAIRGFNERWDAEHAAEPRADAPPTDAAPVALRNVPTSAVREAPCIVPAAVAEPPARDGLCCPQCGSDAVEVARIKVAYQGKELVRRRKCGPCGHEFHTVERIELL